MQKSLADKIEQYIKVLIERSENKEIEIQRSELAETFSCVPSQVTYVINTRFNERNGYITESRRGGKGYVRISCNTGDYEYLMKKGQDLLLFLDRLTEEDTITIRENKMIKCLVTSSFRDLNAKQKEKIFTLIKCALEDFLELS